MSTGDDTGATRSATPTDQPGQAHDAGVTKPETALVAPTGSTPSPSSEPTAPPAASTATPASKPDNGAPDDPVRAALDRLARPDQLPRDEKGRFAPQQASAAGTPAKTDPAKPATAPAKPVAPAAAPAQPAQPKPTDTPSGVETDPYHGFDPAERAALKGRTQERITDLHARWKAAETRAKELEARPAVDQLDTLISEFGLNEDAPFVPPEHLAGLVASQAAVTRSMMALDQGRLAAPADLQVAGEFFTRIDQIRARLGLAPQPVAAAEELKPFAGQLPDDLQELVSIYGLPEADVRLLAAVKARGTRTAGSNQQRAPAAQPPAPTQPAVHQPAKPVGVDMNVLYGQRLVAELAREGVKPEMVQAHYQVLLPLAAQITQERFPTVAADRIPAVFDALPPQERFNIMKEAQGRHRTVSKPVQPAPTPPPPATNQGPMKGPAPRTVAVSANGDAVSEALNYLARPR